MYLQGLGKVFSSEDQKGSAPAAKPQSTMSLISSRGGRNVVALGLTSFFTDISSEMVVAVLPLFFLLELSLGPRSIGIFDGLYNVASAGFRLVGGRIADRTSNPKKTATAGYGWSALSRVGLFIASIFSNFLILPFLIADRFGKGLRVAPRDAIISMSVDESQLGRAFGIHRSLDTMGAVLGYLIGGFILGIVPGAFDAVFFASAMTAGVGVAIIYTLVRNPERRKRPSTEETESSDPSAENANVLTPQELEESETEPGLSIKEVFALPTSRLLMSAATLLTLFTIGDALIYTYLFVEDSVDAAGFAYLFAATSAVYVFLAVPVGAIADRFGKIKVFIIGQAVLVPIYLVLATQDIAGTSMWLLVSSIGIYYACTDGVLPAIAAAISPESHRGTLLGSLSMVVALTKLVALGAFGWLWQATGEPQLIIAIYASGLVLAIIASSVILSKLPINRGGHV